MQENKQFNILAFGDSLTEGLCNQFTWEMVPYTNNLLNLLKEKYQNVQFKIDNMGESGEKVSDSMNQRIEKHLNTNNQYDLVIILGGTNDLGYNIKPSYIFQELKRMHQACWNYNIPTIALTIPQCKAAQEKPQRNEINLMLKQMQQENQKQCFLLDFYELQNYTNFTEDERTQFWAKDGLHFSEQGYSRMGKLIFDKIVETNLIKN